MKRKNENWKDAGVILLLVVVVTIVFITFVTIDNLEKTNEIKELQEENKILKNKIDEIFIKMEDVGYQVGVKS